MEIEIWKDIPDYKGLYQVSSLGRIKSLCNDKTRKEKILSYRNSNGYLMFNLYKNSKIKSVRVHAIVAEVFLNHKSCGHKLVINHKNFVTHDNRVDNLEIVTNRENCNRKHLKSSSKYVGVSWCKRTNKWRGDIRINGKLNNLGRFTNEYEAHLAYQNELNKIAV